ncbi:hypothetical protein [Aegicerativicinus sediminis]|uniref:hypothetical protein n=1 Tax=Aegicerativicinus sediminis TaxID=2893202 RepID=UPI001E361032|nr:hypothetical protein [Aegicerativicinus sediminis]
MNKDISFIYTLVLNDEVLIVETSLKWFHSKLLQRDIGFKMSRSTLSNRFKENERFNFSTPTSSNMYWLQKTPNEDKKTELDFFKSNDKSKQTVKDGIKNKYK